MISDRWTPFTSIRSLGFYYPPYEDIKLNKALMNFDTIYNDIVNKAIPAIAQGVTITKDYFMDIAQRYVTYLIIMDSISVALCILVLIAIVVGYSKLWKYSSDSFDPYMLRIPGGLIAWLISFWLSIGLYESVKDLALDLTVPEIRIYQELKSSTIGSKLP